ncbi:MAG: DUF192 domain-containing protein [Clostridiales bacterium]|nr:DUF192 domain-containing protein [Clostridiales bacterium]
MKKYKALFNGQVIADRVNLADRFFQRAAGLLGKRNIGEKDGLLISPCRQVHTFFMRFNIDVLFLTEAGEILHIEESMTPGNVSPYIKNSYNVLELRSGSVKNHEIKKFKKITFE